MKELTLNGSVYEIPEQSESPTWGEQLTDYLSALNETVNGLISPYDSLNRLFLLNNSVSSNTDVTNAVIDPAVLSGAVLSYSLRRTTSSVTATEFGEVKVTYNSSNAVSAKFELARQQAGSAGLSFYVTDLGQLQYQSSVLAGTGHVGRLRYTIKGYEI